jgi:hypothetical protein
VEHIILLVANHLARTNEDLDVFVIFGSAMIANENGVVAKFVIIQIFFVFVSAKWITGKWG